MKKWLMALILALAAACLTTAAALAAAPAVSDSNFFANGTAVTIDAPGTSIEGRTCLVDNDGTYFSNNPVKFYDSAVIYWGGNDSSGGYVYASKDVTVFGGSDSAKVDGSTSITMNGGTVNTIYGGGNENKAYVEGDTEVSVSGGTVTGSVYGGGVDGDVNFGSGTATVTISQADPSKPTIIGGSVYGGGRNGPAVHTSVTISGGTVTGSVYGGGSNGDVAGDAKVTVTGGTVSASVYGGGESGTVTDNTSVSVSGNPVIGNKTSMGIVLDSIINKTDGRKNHIVDISGALTSDANITLIRNLSAITDGTVVATATTPPHADPTKFTLAGLDTNTYALVADGPRVLVARVYAVTVNRGTADKTTAAQGATVTITANTAETGYAFKEWTTTPGVTFVDGTSAESPTAKFEMPMQAVTATATYEAITYTVNYDGNGSTGGSTASSTHTYDIDKALTPNGFKRVYIVTYNHNYTGSVNTYGDAMYGFKNWNTAQNGAGTSYTDGQSVTNLSSTQGATITLYAIWTPGSVTLPSLTRANYNFGGWYEEATCENKVGDARDSYTPTEDITFYAEWTQKTAVAIDETPVSFVYDGNQREFTVTPTPAGLTGFTVEYKLNGQPVGAYSQTAPSSVGEYDVLVTRAEDATYQKFSTEIAKGLVITALQIGSADVTGVTEPLVGIAQNSNAACWATGVDDTTVAASWSPNHATFRPGTAYTVSITLTAKAGYEFASSPTATINGKTATVSRTSDTEMIVSLAFPPAGTLPYKLVPSGDFVVNNAPEMVFTIGDNTGPFPQDLKKLTLGGKEPNQTSDCTVEQGSIKITLKRDYLNKLKPGKYALRATMNNDSYAETEITVHPRPPKTGDGARPLVWLGLIMAAGLGVMSLVRKRRRA